MFTKHIKYSAGCSFYDQRWFKLRFFSKIMLLKVDKNPKTKKKELKCDTKEKSERRKKKKRDLLKRSTHSSPLYTSYYIYYFTFIFIFHIYFIYFYIYTIYIYLPYYLLYLQHQVYFNFVLKSDKIYIKYWKQQQQNS